MAAADGGVDGQPADDNSVLPEHSASQIGDEAKPADAIQKALDCIKAESSIAKASRSLATTLERSVVAAGAGKSEVDCYQLGFEEQEITTRLPSPLEQPHPFRVSWREVNQPRTNDGVVDELWATVLLVVEDQPAWVVTCNRVHSSDVTVAEGLDAVLQAAASLVLPTDIRGLALATGLSSALYSAPNDSAAALTTLAGSSLAVEVILILVQMVQMLRAAALRKFVSDRHPQAVVAWQWHLLVFDRSALFSSLRAAVKSMPAHILSSSCLTLVTQLRHILLELDKDAGCSAGRRLPPPADVFLPSGGPLAWCSVDSRMVTGPIRAHVRSLLRRQSTAAWSQCAVQGLLPRVAKHVFCPSLDPSLYLDLLCSFPSPWVAWCLTPIGLAPSGPVCDGLPAPSGHSGFLD
ncbi:unnamed protein product [Symbiodinium natans]|uniref:Uncharacterized protein n=1 Tax=Symbiodinium natans TaxID=878477 RepID=A0A812L539_9DINO|nr:unnamed protein product [Symbiodinium natans]